MSILTIKKHLIELENDHDWRKTAGYLYHAWEKQKDDPELTVLLIQQMMMYILDIDNGYLQELHENNNGLETNRALFSEYLILAAAHGLSHVSENKYFIWQICYYLKYIYTYYPLLSVPSIRQGNDTYHSVLEKARHQYSDSLLFPLMDRYSDQDPVLPNTDQEEAQRILAEINDFHLQSNTADNIAKGDLENMYGIILM